MIRPPPPALLLPAPLLRGRLLRGLLPRGLVLRGLVLRGLVLRGLVLPALLLSALLLMSACAAPRPEGRLDAAPAAGAAGGDRQALVAACRGQAQQVLSRQDRGQLIREDERDSRLGADVVGARAPIDRLGRQFAFERMVEDCVRNAAVPGGPPPASAIQRRS